MTFDYGVSGELPDEIVTESSSSDKPSPQKKQQQPEDVTEMDQVHYKPYRRVICFDAAALDTFIGRLQGAFGWNDDALEMMW